MGLLGSTVGVNVDGDIVGFDTEGVMVGEYKQVTLGSP